MVLVNHRWFERILGLIGLVGLVIVMVFFVFGSVSSESEQTLSRDLGLATGDIDVLELWIEERQAELVKGMVIPTGLW